MEAKPLLLVAAIVLLAYTAILHGTLDDLEQDLTDTATYVTSLEREAGDLHAANAALRERALNISARDARTEPMVERPSAPRQHVPFSDVDIKTDAVTIRIDNVSAGIVAPTGSMLPLLTNNTLVLEKTPLKPRDIAPGDIIIYESESTRIIHRVIAVGMDDAGWFAVAKGDSNDEPDPYRVRFPQVRGVVVGIIY